MRLLGVLLFFFGQKESTVTSVKTLFCSRELDGSFPLSSLTYRLKGALKWGGCITGDQRAPPSGQSCAQLRERAPG